MTQLDLFSAPPVQRIPFADCRVEADSVEDFIARYYRGDRLHGYEVGYPGYVAAVIASHKRHYEQYGYDLISRHESTTGQPVAWPKVTEVQSC